MFFRSNSNPFAEATRGIISFIFIVGLMLIGFGVLILAIPQVFVMIAAGIFFFAGLSVIGYAIKLFIAARRFNKASSPQDAKRKNVKVRLEEDQSW